MHVSRPLTFSMLFVGILCVVILFLERVRSPAQNLITGANVYQWSRETSTPACANPLLEDTADGKTQQIISYFTDGATCGFVILVGSDSTYIIYDGYVGPKYGSIRQATFSKDDKPIYLAEFQNAGVQLFYAIVVNGVVQQTFSSHTDAEDAFNQLANSDFASTSYNPNAVHASPKYSLHGNVSIFSYVSPNGRRTVLLTHGGTPTLHVYDYLQEGSWKSQNYNTVDGIRFSPDSKHLAYVAQDEYGPSTTPMGTGSHVVVDNQVGTKEGKIVFLQFSKDSNKLWYLTCPVDSYLKRTADKNECHIVQRVLQ